MREVTPEWLRDEAGGGQRCRCRSRGEGRVRLVDETANDRVASALRGALSLGGQGATSTRPPVEVLSGDWIGGPVEAARQQCCAHAHTRFWGVLLDAGEGTYGQLSRQFGGRAGALDALASLRLPVWISHKHLDHQGGLLRVLEERAAGVGLSQAPARATSCRRTELSGSIPLSSGVAPCPQVLCIRAVRAFSNHLNPLRSALLKRAVVPFRAWRYSGVPVRHCEESGIVMSLWGGEKIVYSGDTHACDRLTSRRKRHC